MFWSEAKVPSGRTFQEQLDLKRPYCLRALMQAARPDCEQHVLPQSIGNLRTTTKFTTTTSVDRERTGTRTSVSAGKRKLKMQSIGRSTTTTLNVNKQVEVVEL